MYVPSQFQEKNPALLFRLMDRHAFATLITAEANGPVANHYPLLVDPERGPHGTIRGHLARSNPQWRSFAEGKEVIAIFHGPHAYVTPSWYGPGVHVPTWNYAAVHAYGTPRLIDDPGTFFRLLSDMVEKLEASFAKPWKLELPDDDRRKVMEMLRQSADPAQRAVGELMRETRSS